MRVLLVSTYDLGRQPFGLASPAAWLRAEGHTVGCADLAVQPLPEAEAAQSDVVAFFLPMHTATRLAARAIAAVRAVNPRARLAAYGHYAVLNAAWLRSLGVEAVFGGEFEAELARFVRRLEAGEDPLNHGPVVSLERLAFPIPDRSTLPPLDRYAALCVDGARRRVGATEASRGCKHRCRHCPVVPVYQGAFRIVPVEVVLEDIRRQVAAGAEHITFGDPDFFNGPAHAVRLVEALHREFPALTYDVTIKIEHLRGHRELLPVLRRTGCLFVTSAVESVEDQVLRKLDKGHTRDDFVAVVEDFRRLGLTLAPTFVPFTPWTTRQGYQDLLRLLVELDMVDAVAPIQLALRLLIPEGSRLLELDDVRAMVGPLDPATLSYPWRHPDPGMDELNRKLFRLVAESERSRASRRQIFAAIWREACEEPLPGDFDLLPRAAVPYLNEPWYC
ncbi:MAG: CUAEP/CCAEP-tail radical SAM protein [Bryobacterales bacterium]|nr:CUAEP/CCAEP-tail radical SAM protein [Bryobacteraceae bacterium]MDW8354463.1 CUAEP/CCAEP-tail radical SAM protein [Bryobacterales bacterium]